MSKKNESSTSVEELKSFHSLRIRAKWVTTWVYKTLLEEWTDKVGSGMREQVVKQQTWNQEMKKGIDLIYQEFPRLQTLDEAVKAMEEKLEALM